MRIKYNRVSTISQSGDRYSLDTDHYDLTLFDRVSGKVPFKEREGGRELVQHVESGQVNEVVFECLSRCGRNLSDTLNTLEWLEENNINVVIRNMGIKSRTPDGKKNPIWKLIVSTLGSIYELEHRNIIERCQTGRQVYVMNGGKLGRPKGTHENVKRFLNKPKNVEIQKLLGRGLRYSEIQRIVDCSPRTISKVKKLMGEVS